MSCSQGEDALSVYLEYVSGGSIHKLLQEYGAFKEPVIQNYTRQILSGLAYLHGRNTVHRYVVFYTNKIVFAVFFGPNHMGLTISLPFLLIYEFLYIYIYFIKSLGYTFFRFVAGSFIYYLFN